MLVDALDGALADDSRRAFCLDAASRASTGGIQVFDRTIAVGDVPDWLADPVSGRAWPARYAFDIDYRHPPAGLGDVKYVWELNRLTYLLPVAATARLRRDASLAGLCSRHLSDWIDRNPPYLGPAWATGIECAIRIVSMVAIDEMLADLLDPDTRQKLATSVATMADWIERFPSRYSSANNHRIAELAGLLLAKTRYPDPSSDHACDALVAELEAEAVRQIHADGVSAEQATGYATLVLEWLAITQLAQAVRGKLLPERLEDRAFLALGALDAVTDRSGNTIVVGDNDETRLLSALTSPTDALPLLHALTGFPRQPTPRGCRTFAEGGYTVCRDVPTRETETLWLFDHGPLGLGELAAHAHSDTLAVWLHVDGFPVLVDAGTYLYHAAREHRDRLRATAMHNTLEVGGVGSSEPSGPFNWHPRRRARARLVDAAYGELWFVEAEHDGYRRLGVVHRRRLERTGSGYRIVDRLIGGPSLPVRFSLLVAPDVTVVSRSDGWLLHREEMRSLIIRTDPSTATLSTISVGMSRSFGRLSDAPMLVAERTLGPDSTLVVDIDVDHVP